MKKLPEFAKYLGVALVASLLAVALYATLAPKPYQSLLDKQQVTPARYASLGDGTIAGFDFTEPAALALPGVVNIQSTVKSSGIQRMPRDFFQFFGEPNEGDGDAPQPESPSSVATGSGVILTADGYIVTNNHVIEEATSVRVTLNDNRSFTAKVIGTDPQTDLALIKIDAADLPFLKVGNSDETKVGQWVLAVGNPFNLTGTVTAGIVSAKGRSININEDLYSVESFIQTDAAVNPGNSGGALVNLQGELIGINTAIASRTGSYAGYSFAIPTKIMTKVIDDLMNYGKVQRGLLGIKIRDVSSELNEERKLGTNQGVLVEIVNENSAASEAGIATGDVIVKADGNTINNTAQLLASIALKRPGDKVELDLLRAGKPVHYNVTLKSQAGDTKLVKAEASDISRTLGATFGELTAGDLKELDVTGGVRVDQLTPGKLRSAGVRVGFVITHVQDEPVKNVAELEKIIDQRIQSGKTSLVLEGKYKSGETAVYAIPLPRKN